MITDNIASYLQIFNVRYLRLRIYNKTKYVSSPYYDFKFNIKSKKDALAFWLTFHNYNEETRAMYRNIYALGGCDYKLYLNKEESIYAAYALKMKKDTDR